MTSDGAYVVQAIDMPAQQNQDPLPDPSSFNIVLVDAMMLPSVWEVEANAQRFCSDLELELTGKYEWLRGHLPMRDGSRYPLKVFGHRDPICTRILAVDREDVLRKGYLKHAHKGNRILIIGNTPVHGVVVDRVVRVDDLLGPQDFARATDIVGQMDAVPLDGFMLRRAAIFKGWDIPLDDCLDIAAGMQREISDPKGNPNYDASDWPLFRFRIIDSENRVWSNGVSTTAANRDTVIAQLSKSLNEKCEIRDYKPFPSKRSLGKKSPQRAQPRAHKQRTKR